MGILLILKKHRNYKRNRKVICIASISTCNTAAETRIWAVWWFLNNMAMIQTPVTQILNGRK